MKQFRIVEQELEDCEARINSIVYSPKPEDQSMIKPRAHVFEAGSDEEIGSSEEGSIGGEEEVRINKSVLRRQTSPVGVSGRSNSPGRTTFSQRLFGNQDRKISMFSGNERVNGPSTPRDVEQIALEGSLHSHDAEVMVVPVGSLDGF